MAQEREDARPAGRSERATAPPRGPQTYPMVNQTDGVEGPCRSFDPAADAPTARHADADACPTATQEGRLGPEGDPAEGKR